MSGKSLLVIGGSGFFGKSILDGYARGLLTPWGIDRIIVVARKTAALRQTHPQLLGAGIRLVDMDIGTATELPPADYIIHAASSTDARRYLEAPLEERANILGAIENFARLVRSGSGGRIVYASSGAVYGQVPQHISHVTEDFEPGDVSDMVPYKRDYAEAKRAAEEVLAQLGERSGLNVSVARCFAFVGAFLPRDQHFAIGNFLADGLAGRPIVVKARHPVFRSYMHSDDLVRWLMTIAAASNPACPIYNVGSDEAVSLAASAELVALKLGTSAEIPALTSDATDRYVPSTERARRLLGLDLQFGFEAAMDDVIARLRTAPPPEVGRR